MTTLILGASGFVGAWTARAVAARDERVVALLRPSSDAWRLAGVEGLTVRREDPADWAQAISRISPRVVLSFDWAGVAGADRDARWQRDNVDRLVATYMASVAAGAECFIGVGSQAEFGPREGRIAEGTPPAPVTEYGRAKAAARERLMELGAAHHVAVTWARVFSTYGPLDNSGWLLPQVAQAISRNEPIDLTEGVQRWSYLHGADAGEAFAYLAAGARGGDVNVGHPDAVVLRHTVERFADALGGRGLLRFGARAYGTDPVMHLEPALDTLTGLGWRPKVPLDVGLTHTARWWQGLPVTSPLPPGDTLPNPRT